MIFFLPTIENNRPSAIYYYSMPNLNGKQLEQMDSLSKT